MLRQPEHCCFHHVLEYCETTGHVAIQRAVPCADFALITGAQHQPAEFVGKRHQISAPDSRLEIFLGYGWFSPLEPGSEGRFESLKHFGNGYRDQFDAEICSKLFGVVDASPR